MSRADLGIALPPSWRRRSDPDRGVLVTARSHTVPDSGFRPELTLRCSPVTEDLASWRASAMAELDRALEDFEVEDEDDYDLDGRPVAYRRFAHRAVTADLVSEQWSWLVDGLGVTLTGTVAREDYPAYCDLFEAVAATVDPGPRAA